MKMINEDAPTNSAGSGNIAGIRAGPNGEPGVKIKNINKYKKKNQEEAPDPIIGSLNRRKTYLEFVKGK